MDKKIAGLIGAVSAVASVTGAQAAVALERPVLQASSYDDLLKPIPDAVTLLKADDAVLKQAEEQSMGATIEMAQYYHHHHHHHRFFRPFYHHHHHRYFRHHHHHHQYRY